MCRVLGVEFRVEGRQFRIEGEGLYQKAIEG